VARGTFGGFCALRREELDRQNPVELLHGAHQTLPGRDDSGPGQVQGPGEGVCDAMLKGSVCGGLAEGGQGLFHFSEGCARTLDDGPGLVGGEAALDEPLQEAAAEGATAFRSECVDTAELAVQAGTGLGQSPTTGLTAQGDVQFPECGGFGRIGDAHVGEQHAIATEAAVRAELAHGLRGCEGAG
jgi:hypothetical protein